MQIFWIFFHAPEKKSFAITFAIFGRKMYFCRYENNILFLGSVDADGGLLRAQVARYASSHH